MPAIRDVLPVGRTGGAQFDPSDRYIYFLASNPIDLTIASSYSRYLLIAVNEIDTPKNEELFNSLVGKGNTLFLDSGVFNLAMEHASRHKLSHDEALRTPVDQIDGFANLKEKYIRITAKNEGNLWGYVEIDLGGADQKRKTRAELESLGLRPIPVYHPLNDGWDYFDELAQKYDRICVGNVVQASRYVRLRIMATIFERKRKYPGLWVHLLGMTANEWAYAYPTESMDSSTWLAGVRWPDAWKERACLKTVDGFSKKYTYKLGDRESWYHAKCAAAMQCALNQRNWRHLDLIYGGKK